MKWRCGSWHLKKLKGELYECRIIVVMTYACFIYLFDLVGCIFVGPVSVWNVYGVTSDQYSMSYK